MRATVVAVWLLLMICCRSMIGGSVGAQLEGLVQSECRDRYLWIRVASPQTPGFEAVDGDGAVHAISKQLASRCGYTISTFRPEGFTIFRASYYSCFTHSQNDEVFTFKLNVVFNGGRGSRLSSHLVSTVCSGLSWTHRELTCEEDYMEVNVNRESSCGGQGAEGRQVWQEALFKAQRTASWSWQLMFLQSNGQTTSMSVPEAQRWGYSLTSTSQRVMLRSPFKQPHAEVTMVDGVPVETVRASLFFKQKLVLMMIDMSMACTLNSGSFDGSRLLWDVPQVLPTLVGEGAGFKSRSFGLGLEGFLLDEATATSRGLSLVHQEGMVKIGVPFGSGGGFRKSLVVENMYKELYKALLMYEHVFSLVFDDGHSMDTKHRIFKVLETPLICRPPFSLNQTIGDEEEFTVYLGNIPKDVLLEEVWINGQRLLILGKPQQGLSIKQIVHVNGSQAYELRLPFNDPAVKWTNMGGGVVEYSIDLNFTLTVVPQRESYHHQNLITAQVFNAFPPEITAQCLDGGISFIIARQSLSLWEVGIDQEPLTEQLVAQRGYRLYNDSHRTILEVPVFSVGYTYEEINLSNFYAAFKLLLRDSKTLEVQASASKRCLFRTEDMIVCSPDGTMTVVATPTSTWPMVKPERTSLLDRNCKPKQTDGARVLFEFMVDSCGTRAIVGEWYIVYENEILHDRLLIADGPNFISRDPQFKVTLRCFYPLSTVNRVSLDRTFASVTPGFGSVRVFESQRESTKKQCAYQHSERTDAPSDKLLAQSAEGTLPLSGLSPRPKPGKSHFITIPGQNKVLSASNRERLSERPIYHVPQLYQFPEVDNLSGPVENLEGEAWGTPGQNKEYLTLGSFDNIPNAPVGENLDSQTPVSLNEFPEGGRDIGLPWGQSTIGQRDIVQHPQLQSLLVDLSSGLEDLKQPTSNLYGSSGAGMEAGEIQKPVYQPQYLYKPTEFQSFLQPDDHIWNKPPQPSNLNTLDPVKNSVADPVDHLQGFFYNRPLNTAPTQEGPGPIRWNIQSRVQSVRVKPPSRFTSSVLHLNQKPIVQQINSQTTNLLKHASGTPLPSIDGNRWSYQQSTENGGTKPGAKLVPQRPGASAPMQELGLQSILDESLVFNFTNPSSKEVELLLVFPGSQQAEHHTLFTNTNDPIKKLGSYDGPVLQKQEPSRIRVRPAGHAVRLQTLDQDKRSQAQEHFLKEGVRRIFYQNPAQAHASVQSPTEGEQEAGHLQTDPDGSEPKPEVQSGTFACGGESGLCGNRVHQGILRGERL